MQKGKPEPQLGTYNVETGLNMNKGVLKYIKVAMGKERGYF